MGWVALVVFGWGWCVCAVSCVVDYLLCLLLYFVLLMLHRFTLLVDLLVVLGCLLCLGCGLIAAYRFCVC